MLQQWSFHSQSSVLVTQSCLTLCNPVDYSPPGSSVHGIQQEQWSGQPFSSPGDLPDPRIEPRSPALQANSLLPEPPGKSLSPQVLCRKSQYKWRLIIQQNEGHIIVASNHVRGEGDWKEATGEQMSHFQFFSGK